MSYELSEAREFFYTRQDARRAAARVSDHLLAVARPLGRLQLGTCLEIMLTESPAAGCTADAVLPSNIGRGAAHQPVLEAGVTLLDLGRAASWPPGPSSCSPYI